MNIPKAKLSIIILITMMSLTACSKESFHNGSTNKTSEVISKCIQLVNKHVEKERGWTTVDYKVTEVYSPDGGKSFSVMHQDDAGLRPPGGGKSFEVQLDDSCTKVLRELSYQ